MAYQVTLSTKENTLNFRYEKAVEQKKDDFRKYLDKNGVVDALTNGN
jgi:hypothetical protein